MSNTIYTIFDKNTGAQKFIWNIPSTEDVPQVGVDEIIKEGTFSSDKILLFNNIFNKQLSKIMISGNKIKTKEYITLSNLENPTKVEIQGKNIYFEREIIDNNYEFSFDLPGEYIIKCDSQLELPIEFKIEVI